MAGDRIPIPMPKREYPRRESHFAHRYVRLLFRTCAAQEIGIEALTLLVAIAHTEDAKRYRAAVTYWNDQLQSILACSLGRLVRARDKAINHGWLHYEPGTKSHAGRYWVTIPDQFEGMADTPFDHDPTDFQADIPFQNEREYEEHPPTTVCQNGREPPEHGSTKWEGMRRECGGNVEGKRAPFYPIPNPNPFPKEVARSRKPRREPVVWSPEGGWSGITDDDRKRWETAFPAVDVNRALAAMEVYLVANPKKAHKSNWLRFVSNWLSRNQDRGGDARSNGKPGKPAGKTSFIPEDE